MSGPTPSNPRAMRDAIAGLNALERHVLNESATRAIYAKIVRAGDVVLDCGANCGEHTRSLSALAGATGRVHAFEPNAAHFPALLGIAPNVRLWPFAVGDALAIRTLHVPEGLDGWASLSDIRDVLHDRAFTLASTVELPPDALPELAGAAIRFIKMDVENNELSALHGMRGLLARSMPPIILENVNAGIVAFLAEAGYRLHDLTGGVLEGGASLLPNAAALPHDLSPEAAAAMLLSAEEAQALLDQARAEAAAAPAEPPPPGPVARPATAEARLREAEAQLERLTGSLSWRITAPLRRVRGLFG
jgi:FkbM family methyltransferase